MTRPELPKPPPNVSVRDGVPGSILVGIGGGLLALGVLALCCGCAPETTLHIEADTAWRAEIAGRHESGRTSRTFEVEPEDCATVYVLGSGWCRAYMLRRTPGLVPDHEWSEHIGGSRGDTLRVCGGDIE